MKIKFFIFLNMLFVIIRLEAQDYQINFDATGKSDTITSVLIENLTKGTSITLNSGTSLRLVSTLTGSISLENKINSNVRFYPNPLVEDGVIEFAIYDKTSVHIDISNYSGQSMASFDNLLSEGIHQFKVKGLVKGVYFYRVRAKNYTYSGKILSNSVKKGNVTLAYIGTIESKGDIAGNPESDNSLKSSVNEVKMLYNNNDVLKFKAVSGIYSTIITDVPVQSKTITFNFNDCTDGDGNHYSTIQIGTQVWMAENLKTTKLNDSINIYKPSETYFDEQKIPAYMWYLESSYSYKETYGALYNWHAVNTNKLCPVGWHVPSDPEWTIMENYLGGKAVAGGKLKETSQAHWISPNFGATNISGFTARPGGGHVSDFFGLGSNGYWWTSTINTYNNDIYYRNIGSWTNEIFTYDWAVYEGCSVRCIKD